MERLAPKPNPKSALAIYETDFFWFSLGIFIISRIELKNWISGRSNRHFRAQFHLCNARQFQFWIGFSFVLRSQVCFSLFGWFALWFFYWLLASEMETVPPTISPSRTTCGTLLRELQVFLRFFTTIIIDHWSWRFEIFTFVSTFLFMNRISSNFICW